LAIDVPARFPPAVRLKVRREFTAVQEAGRRVSSKYMTLLGQPNNSQQDRLGIIASRRLGGAVDRNRAKRVLREVFRKQIALRQAAPFRALDLVVIPRTDLLTAPFGVIETEFASAVRRLRSAR
jgi:ribonuclease P protein component